MKMIFWMASILRCRRWLRALEMRKARFRFCVLRWSPLPSMWMKLPSSFPFRIQLPVPLRCWLDSQRPTNYCNKWKSRSFPPQPRRSCFPRCAPSASNLSWLPTKPWESILMLPPMWQGQRLDHLISRAWNKRSPWRLLDRSLRSPRIFIIAEKFLSRRRSFAWNCRKAGVAPSSKKRSPFSMRATAQPCSSRSPCRRMPNTRDPIGADVILRLRTSIRSAIPSYEPCRCLPIQFTQLRTFPRPAATARPML